MLNTSIKTHSSIIGNITRKINLAYFLLVVFASMLLPACSVMQSTSNTENTDVSVNTEHKTSFTQAISAMKAGKLKQAQTLLISLIDEHPNSSNAHVNLGIIFLKNKSLNEAENLFQRALKINPDNIYALNQLGILYRQQGDFSNSRSAYEKAININSEYALAHLNIGILYDLYLYDFPKAIEHYKKYMEITKDKDKQVNKWIVDLERRYKKSLALK